MPNYMITYDAPAGTNYQPFYDAIAEHDSAHLSLSVWLISTAASADIVKDWAKGLFGDRTSVAVAVIQIHGDWGTDCVSQKASDWLEAHLGSQI